MDYNGNNDEWIIWPQGGGKFSIESQADTPYDPLKPGNVQTKGLISLSGSAPIYGPIDRIHLWPGSRTSPIIDAQLWYLEKIVDTDTPAEPDEHNITIVNGDGTTFKQYYVGATVAVNADYKANHTFVEWEATGIELSAEQKMDPMLLFDMPDNNATLIAKYEEDIKKEAWQTTSVYRISEDSNGKCIDVNASVTNNTALDKTVNIIVATYDLEGKLLSVDNDELFVPAGQTKPTKWFNKLDITDESNCDVKVFTWDLDYIPLTKVQTPTPGISQIMQCQGR